MPTHLFMLQQAWLEQRLASQRLLAEHLRAGDDLTRSRLVTHLAAFPRALSAQLFRTSLTGFVATEYADERTGAFRVVFAREDVLGEEHIHKVTYGLLTSVLTYEGRYEGWSALLVPRAKG